MPLVQISAHQILDLSAAELVQFDEKIPKLTVNTRGGQTINLTGSPARRLWAIFQAVTSEINPGVLDVVDPEPQELWLPGDLP